MFKVICLFVLVGVSLCNRPLYGSPECHHALTLNCSTFSDEPVCASMNNCVSLCNRPLYGSPECHHALSLDCSTFPYEPVCASVNDRNTTINNSCEFGHAICSHHGHSVHAIYTGPCV